MNITETKKLEGNFCISASEDQGNKRVDRTTKGSNYALPLSDAPQYMFELSIPRAALNLAGNYRSYD